MIKPIYSTKKDLVIDEIISNATELPLEKQEMLLVIAKAMQYTKNSIMRENATDDINS